MKTGRPDETSKDAIRTLSEIRALAETDSEPISGINIILLIPHLAYGHPDGWNPEKHPRPHSHPKQAKFLVERFIAIIESATEVRVDHDGSHYSDIPYGRWNYNFWGSSEKLLKFDMTKLYAILELAKTNGHIADYEAWRQLGTADTGSKIG
uniref:Uncharacterized protein n=1 Tax=Pithovirus LCPAC103 TaxID=2506588 RepID=A0A481Z4Y8_9VIRU|nr:MAG: hypothetical protein LCPAC103_01630 [Pithovirus LCPAC103]